MNTHTTSAALVQNLNHPVKIRKIKVIKIENLSPTFRKITFQSDELKDFITASPDDHIKVFFPNPETGHYTIPALGEKGLQWNPEEPEPIMRDYTPINYNPQTQTLELIFFLRDHGPAAMWVKQAELGQELFIAGPRGSFVVSYDFDWFMFFVDEAGLPSVYRRLQEMPKTSKGWIFASITSSAHHSLDLQSVCPPEMHIQWIANNNTLGSSEPFIENLTQLNAPQGRGFVWIKTESLAAMQIRSFILKQNLTEVEWIKTSGYWKKQV